MDKVWIIVKGKNKDTAYNGLFFISEEAANEYKTSLPHNELFNVIGLKLFNEYLV